MNTKTCARCKQEKPLSEFRRKWLKKTQAYHSYCKPCYNKYKREWRNKNKIKSDLANKRCKLRIYGLTPDDYDKMYNNQGGKCLICGIHQSELKESLCVDHDHNSKEIRGLLCKSCNSGIGLLQDSADLCSVAADYLRMYKD